MSPHEILKLYIQQYRGFKIHQPTVTETFSVVVVDKRKQNRNKKREGKGDIY